MLFSPYHGDPKQARLMSDFMITINAEGQSSICSKCCVTSNYDNQRDGLDQHQGSFVRTYCKGTPLGLKLIVSKRVSVTKGWFSPVQQASFNSWGQVTKDHVKYPGVFRSRPSVPAFLKCYGRVAIKTFLSRFFCSLRF